MAQPAIRTAPINLRALVSQRNLIDKAAAVLGKNRSDFMLEIICREAENVLLDQCFFKLNKTAFDQFIAKLEEPVVENTALKRLMSDKSPWE